MVGWHPWLSGHEFEYTLVVGDGQRGLVCCSPGGGKELDMTEQLNWAELMQTFVGKVMSLFFNMLCRFAIAFFPKEQASFNFMAASTVHSDLIKSVTASMFFAIYLPWSDGTRCYYLCFLNVEFKPAFSLSSFILIKRLFCSSLTSAIRVVLSANLTLLIFLTAALILIMIHPAWHFSWHTLHVS